MRRVFRSVGSFFAAVVLAGHAAHAAAAATVTRPIDPDIAITPVDNYEQWKAALDTGKGAVPPTFSVLPGFEIETLRVARPDEGSWVALSFDAKGRLIIARERKGLLRFTLSDGTLHGEVVNDTLEEVRGIVDTLDGLFVNANVSKGLFRLRDTNRDDQYDEITPLVKTRAGGHGRNALVAGPDGHLFMIHGDAVDFPPALRRLTPPTVPGLLPGDDLPRGHFLRTDRDAHEWTLVASGLRNPVGVDFNAEGEAFTYDADAEADMGMPWYRPTHVRHLVSGAEFGWRRVTGRWPPYYPDQPDNPPTTLVIGKGSPTAVKFGTRSRFPPAYQRALFIMDWAYGRIVAVHLTPQGASYAGRAETFLRGRPLNVTALDFGPDGAMYFVTGGRNTQSALYRVRYIGPIVTDPLPTPWAAERLEASARARALRRKLETYHGRQDRFAVATAWPLLNHPDPWLAHAARVAIEHQPADDWAPAALAEPDATKALPALMALTRVGADKWMSDALSRLTAIPATSLDREQARVFVRAAGYAVQRLRNLEPGARAKLIAALDVLVPTVAEANREACRLLIQLEAPSAVEKATALLAAAHEQEEKLHYLHLLGSARTGWTEENRARYFRVLAQTPTFRGGAGLPRYVKEIRNAAIATVPESELARFLALLDATPAVFTPPASAPRAFVKAWTMSDLVAGKADGKRKSDHARGKQLFGAAQCIMCHRIGADGGTVGPDLTDVSSRFSTRDILESILEPSRVISETYRHVVVATKDGRTITGRVMPVDYRLPVLRLASNPLSEESVEVPKDEIVSYGESEVSPMPPGLLDTLTREEISDLLAYIESGGRM
jgi:putative heme-binding domain-containing protein